MPPDQVGIPHIPPLDSIRLLGWYHFRKDGYLPYYKKEIFTKEWIRSQCKDIEKNEKLASLQVLPLVCVLDKDNYINTYIVARNSESLRFSSWILREACSSP
jgi:hypothetical protein